MRVRRLVWRHVPAGAVPLHLGYIERARGRWNLQRPRIACLYTAYSMAGALAEYERAVAGEPALAVQPRDLVSLRVDVEGVLDLADAQILSQYGAEPADLVGAGYGPCRRIVRAAIL